MTVRRVPAKANPFNNAFAANATITVGAEATNAITVGVQLKGPGFANLAARACLRFYLADAATGAAPVATAPDGGFAAGATGNVTADTGNKAGRLITDAAGRVDIVVTESGVKTLYVVLVMPDGSLVVSGAVTFA